MMDPVSQCSLAVARAGIDDPVSPLAGHILVNTLEFAAGAQVSHTANGKQHRQGAVARVTPGAIGA
jgi:hypothetical protein